MQAIFGDKNASLLKVNVSGIFPKDIISDLWKLNLAKNLPVVIYGKTFYQRRDIGFYSDKSEGYRYSGNIVKSQKLTRALKIVLCAINSAFKENFNGILVNLYKDGNDKIGAHSDDETALGNSGVISISFGQTRKFVIRNKGTKKIVETILLEDGDLIWMKGKDFQKLYTHEIPEEKKVSEPRLSLTFRHHLN